MPRLSFYVPEDSARLLRQRALQKGLSLSKYLASLVLRDTGSSWPRDYFENAVGFWEGELERPPQGRTGTAGKAMNAARLLDTNVCMGILKNRLTCAPPLLAADGDPYLRRRARRAILQRRSVPNDFLIAANARAHDCILVSRHTRGLRVENWAD